MHFTEAAEGSLEVETFTETALNLSLSAPASMAIK